MVFVVVHQGFVARYLLHTDIVPTLAEAGCEVVVLTPNHDEARMIDEYAGTGIALEQLRDEATPPARSTLDAALRYGLRFALDGRASAAFANKYAKSRARLRGRNARWYAFAVDFLVRRVLWRSPRARRQVLRREIERDDRALHADLFDRYRPALVIAGGPGYFRPDAIVLREAARRGVPTAAVVMSWDNPTSKGYRGADPDFATAWSDQMAEQLHRFQDIDPAAIDVVGVAHWDHYLRDGGVLSREELCAELGLDPVAPIVSFASNSPGSHAANLDIAGALADAVERGDLGDSAQLVLRPHPNYFGGGKTVSDHTMTEEFGAIAARSARVVVNRPMVGSRVMRTEIERSDTPILAALVRHSDVLVNLFSTTSLEAMICDTPVVAVDSDAVGVGGRIPVGGGRFSEFAHSATVSRGARVAHTLQELVVHVRHYLDHPESDREGRAQVAASECGPLDGRSGHRTAARLLERIGVEPPSFDAVQARSAARLS